MEGCQKTFVTRAGINVRYLEAGEGPAVLLVHGLATSKVTWYCNIDALVSGGYRVLALDLPGHGDSDKPKDLKYEPAGAVELIRQFLVELELDRVSLVGNSAGGLLVGLFSLAYPQQVEKLVLVAPGGLGRHVTWLLRFLSVPMLGELFYQPRLQSPMNLARRIFFRPPAILAEVLPEMDRVRNLPGSRHAAIQSIRSSVNLLGQRRKSYILDRLRDLKPPLLTIWGEEDAILPVSQAAAVRRALPRSVTRVIPECGHWPHMEKAEQFNELLVQFLDGSLSHSSPDNP
jgi:pimeloyl-ACP methyl ester carboxylesterase